ncbi:MAG: hypothetical protein HWE13_08685 [Gammaproteobacteria bacterium]|nr:hypothetical protein [Gammaproteobacteria bacterium]NVK88190.1 hypothetical protein [Gammaproteobacteria bacterium]
MNSITNKAINHWRLKRRVAAVNRLLMGPVVFITTVSMVAGIQVTQLSVHYETMGFWDATKLTVMTIAQALGL